MSVATVTNIRYDLASLLFVRLVTFFLFQFVCVLFHVTSGLFAQKSTENSALVRGTPSGTGPTLCQIDQDFSQHLHCFGKPTPLHWAIIISNQLSFAFSSVSIFLLLKVEKKVKQLHHQMRCQVESEEAKLRKILFVQCFV